MAIGSQARFFARVGGNTPKEMTQIFIETVKFKGTSLIEVMQNCPIFNDGAYDEFTNKEVREDRQLFVEHGKPMIFGKERNKGLILNGLKLQVVTIGENGIKEEDILVHNAKEEDPTLHQMLVRSKYPLVTGIIRSFEEMTFGAREAEQTAKVMANSKFKKTDDLFFSGDIYQVF